MPVGIHDLLDALLFEEPQARQAWERWRASIEIDALPYAAQQLLPALNAKLPEWLDGDPAAGIFQGIIRKAWSQNQVRLRKGCELALLLKQAGVERPAIVGPLAWSLRSVAAGIRTIPCLTFLVKRTDVAKATRILIAAGWRPYTDPPAEDLMDWSEHIAFGQENLVLYLHWRLVPSPPEDALHCEQEFLKRLTAVKWSRRTLLTTSPEATLAHVLCGRRESDLVPWQADIGLTGTTRIDSARFSKLVSRFAPAALERLQELRARGLPVADLRPENPSPFERKFRQHWSAYRAWSYQVKQQASWLGFLNFLSQRSNQSVWKMPFFVLRRAFRAWWMLAR